MSPANGQMAAGTDRVADAAQRARALDVTKSFIVQAPAGSGKTGLLVLRFLALLALVKKPEAVLAITFTRKAAGEMRRRIVEALVEADTITESPNEAFERERWHRARAVLERDAAQGWGILQSPSRLQVFTIDGFCSRVVASTPLLSRLGSTPSVVNAPSILYREAVRRTLAPSGRAYLREHFEVLLERYEMGIDRLEEQLVEMLSRREQWGEAARGRDDEDAWVAGVEAALRRAMGVEVDGLAEDAEPGIVSMIHDLARVSRDVLGDACRWATLGDKHRLGPGVEAAPAWKQAAALLLRDASPELRTAKSKNASVHGDDTTVKARLHAVIAAIGSLPEGAQKAWAERLGVAAKLPVTAAFGPDGRAALGAFLAVLRTALGNLWNVFREQREVDHSEVSMRAVAALGPGETLEKLDARLEHILIDEFQDTNVLQCELLGGLVSGWQPGGGQTLFLVGDPMQSIYRFRKAEVGLFLAAWEGRLFHENCRLEPLKLTVNFRSTTQLVGWVGRSFSLLLGDRDDATRSLVAFAPAAPKPDADSGPDMDFVMWSPSGPDPVAGLEADKVEAAGLAEWIAGEVAALRSGAGSATEQGKAAPFAVLVRARTHAQPLLRALEAGAPQVRVRAPGLDKLADRATVIDLEALVRALLHPGDRLAWLSLLRSRWVGLSLADLAALVETDVVANGSRRATPVPLLLTDEAALERISKDARQRLRRLRPVLGAARRDLASRSIDIVIRSAWLRLGGPAAGREATPTDALDAEAFFDLLSERARAGRIDLDDFARALRDTEAPVDSEAEVDVEIMTMHKAKGLEFDTVVLPALGRASGRTNTPPLGMETDPDNGRLTVVAPRGARGREDADGDKYDFLQLREKRRGSSETLRLLYVAVTRARRRLVLSATVGRLKKDGDPSAGSLLAALTPALPVASARHCVAPEPAAAPRRALLRFPVVHTLACVPASVADRSVASERPSEREVTPEMFDDGRMAAAAGIVFHAFAERIASDGVQVWPVSRVAEEGPAIEHALRSQGVLPTELADAVRRVAVSVSAILADERGRWILEAHEDARSEWAVTAWDGQRMTSAQIDRTFLVNGVRWIVDFKTGAWPESLDDEEADAHAAGKCEAYAPQLARYREMLQAVEPGREVRVALYFPDWPLPRRWQDITSLAETPAAN